MTGARLIGAAAAIAALVAAPLADGAPRTPARLQVSADEFTLVLSRSSLRAGAAVVELVNYGEDDHDLALRRVAKGARTFRIRTVRPGTTGDLDARLPAGRYRLWCTLPQHRARGMSATLVVRVA